ncbi:MAG TPA: hypothetical protein VH020_13950 [Stellaceae bacterium]|nr:hypothetical protein [Stellaceae bacterium]
MAKKIKRAQQRARKYAAAIDWVLLGQKIAAGADLSIAEWCAKRGYSRPTYVNYRNAGLGPTEIVASGRVTITPAADAEWAARFSRPARGRPRKAAPGPDAAEAANGSGA